MDYEKKYLKYKRKYLAAKNIMFGGTIDDEKLKKVIDSILTELKKEKDAIILKIKEKIDNYNIKMHNEELPFNNKQTLLQFYNTYKQIIIAIKIYLIKINNKNDKINNIITYIDLIFKPTEKITITNAASVSFNHIFIKDNDIIIITIFYYYLKNKINFIFSNFKSEETTAERIYEYLSYITNLIPISISKEEKCADIEDNKNNKNNKNLNLKEFIKRFTIFINNNDNIDCIYKNIYIIALQLIDIDSLAIIIDYNKIKQDKIYADSKKQFSIMNDHIDYNIKSITTQILKSYNLAAHTKSNFIQKRIDLLKEEKKFIESQKNEECKLCILTETNKITIEQELTEMITTREYIKKICKCKDEKYTGKFLKIIYDIQNLTEIKKIFPLLEELKHKETILKDKETILKHKETILEHKETILASLTDIAHSIRYYTPLYE